MLGIYASYVAIAHMSKDDLIKIIEKYPPPHTMGCQALKNRNTPTDIIRKYSSKS
ncbi:hypothetical protein [Aliarcobacter butzleri]|uniref:hypothetical protein n=1 Tax=Aliarcobacter butzleri TaxID=28197 RepID=UPI0018697016|nr:hypothetical protein [Aliarcobacter butzleri]